MTSRTGASIHVLDELKGAGTDRVAFGLRSAEDQYVEGAKFVSDVRVERPGHPSSSIVDLVFAGKTGGGGAPPGLAYATVLACYVGLFVVSAAPDGRRGT